MVQRRAISQLTDSGERSLLDDRPCSGRPAEPERRRPEESFRRLRLLAEPDGSVEQRRGSVVSGYRGRHSPDLLPRRCAVLELFLAPLFRLYPYADTPNNGGVYIMATCYRGPAGGPFAATVDPHNCKYDAFKVLPPEAGLPRCQLFQVIQGPPKQIQVIVQDPTTGMEDITYTANNATVDVPDFFVGDVDPILVTGTKINQTQGAVVSITATTVSGFQITCDPVLSGQIAGHEATHPAYRTTTMGRA